MPIPGTHDVMVEDEPTALHFETGGDLVLEPGTTYYLTLLHINCAAVDLTVTASATFGDPPAGDDDAGDDDDAADDDDDDGCSCRTAGSRLPWAGSAALLVLVAVITRRRLR